MLWLLWLMNDEHNAVNSGSVEMDCLCTVRQVVHTLPEGLPVCGVTSLAAAGEIYVLRRKGRKGRDEVEVYDVV